MTLPFSLSIRPALSGVVFPPVPRADMALLFSLCQQLEQTQWLTADQLRELQFAQLTSIAQHARETVPYYRTLLAEAGVDPSCPLTPESWSSIRAAPAYRERPAGSSSPHCTALPCRCCATSCVILPRSVRRAPAAGGFPPSPGSMAVSVI